MNRKSMKTRYMLITIIVIFMFLLGVTSQSLNEERELNFFEKTIKDTGVFAQKIFYAPIKIIKEKIETIEETNNLYKKYADLKDPKNWNCKDCEKHHGKMI